MEGRRWCSGEVLRGKGGCFLADAGPGKKEAVPEAKRPVLAGRGLGGWQCSLGAGECHGG
jgi:hypothetical protein